MHDLICYGIAPFVASRIVSLTAALRSEEVTAERSCCTFMREDTA